MSELKPCPFCGSEQPQDSKDDGNVPYEFGMSRSCKFCSAAVNLGWNNRPIEDALQARIAELEAYIDQLIEIGGWAITGMTIATSYSPGVLQNIAERKSDDWYALINNLKECDKEKEREI